ncbi:glycerophosphodiester phosphodiesterase family protein [Alkalibacterium sp. 20]|uniref:glycerophosphodiester phosphodiesterase n=1 Tax=Alkalibacterium sp. 20 TaxID=1798803 RepID=UPI0015A70FB1|nr:glycerophosphodiester phosphodiesterase family protein [Alkalibacterium sp. 20]
MRRLNIAHRGFSGQYPENTLLAFERAYEAGADGVELDVQLTKDKEVVIFHDDTIDRMTGGTGKLNDYTLIDLESYPITHPLQENLKQQFIPTLSDYLIWAADKPIITNIELKSEGEEDNELERKVAEVLRRFNTERTIIISSFHKKSIARIKQLMPKVKIGLILSECDEPTIQMAKDLDAEFIHLKASSLNAQIIQLANEYGMGINVWTVNESEDLKKINNLDIEGIITDYPD